MSRRFVTIIWLLACPLAVMAQTRVDVDRQKDFTLYKTFAVEVAPPIDVNGVKDESNTLAQDRFRNAVMRELQSLLHLDAMTVTGETLGERLAAPLPYVDREIVRSIKEPYQPYGGLVALFGSLAPGGAILKRSAADPKLFEREGRAVVFTSLEDLAARIDAPDLDVTPDDFLVLQNAGPKSSSGMPEAGYLPIPAKLARAGVKDMVRVSDARMSGTAYGTIVLHVTPEAAIGGPLSLVKNGDRIRLSVRDRRIDLLVDDGELARRRVEWRPPSDAPRRGYRKLYFDHVLQADRGCDFDFLRKPD